MTPSRAVLARSDAKASTERPVRLMQRVYRDVGLAAVARELELSTPDLETEVVEAVKRGARYVYLAPKADRESQAPPRQPASAMSTDRGPPDACAAAVSASLREPAPVTREARHVNLAPSAECESGRNDITGSAQALPRRPASAISPPQGSHDASAAAVPSLFGPEPVKGGASYLYLAPKADPESTRNDTAAPTQAPYRRPASTISPARESSDWSAAALPASLIGPEAVKRGAPDARLAPKAAPESARNDIAGPTQALPRRPVSVISPRESPDVSADAVPASLIGLEAVKRGAPDVRHAPKAAPESARNDIAGPTRALPRRPVSAIYPAEGSPDASAVTVLASLLGLEPVKRDAPHVNSAPKAEHESTRNDITGLLEAMPRQPVSAVSPARGSSDASAAVDRHLNLSPKSDRESRRNDSSSPSQKLLPQPAWGLLLRRQPASAVSPARGLPDASAFAVARHLNSAPKTDRESGRNDVSTPSQPLLRKPASAIFPARGLPDASAVAVARRVNFAPKADRESRRNDISTPSQPLLRRPASAVSPGWGLLLRRQPASAISPAGGLPDGRAVAVAAPLVGPSVAGRRAGSSSVKIIRGEAGPILRAGSEEGAEAHEQSIEVTPGRFKRLDKSFWPLLPKN
jgi:hypothetical protein